MALKPKQLQKPTVTKRPAVVPNKSAPATKVQVPPPPATTRPAYIPQTPLPDVPMDDGLQPSLNIVQMISNELVPGDPKYIAEARAGMLVNTATRELFDGAEGVLLIPVFLRKYWTEWIPRAQGGGFVAQYEVKEEMEAQRKPENEVAAVFEFVCILAGRGEDEMVRVQFNTATKYPVARKWASLMSESGTVCGRKYLLTTVLRQNKAKQPYYVFDVKEDAWCTKEEYAVAEALNKSMCVPQLAEGPGREEM